MSFRNDLPRPVQVGLCDDTACLHVRWWIGVDRGAVATEPVPSDGSTHRFLVAGPPDAVYGCLVFRFDRGRDPVAVALSSARGCGSGR